MAICHPVVHSHSSSSPCWNHRELCVHNTSWLGPDVSVRNTWNYHSIVMIYSYAITTWLQKSHDDRIDENYLYVLVCSLIFFFLSLAHSKGVFKEGQNSLCKQFSRSTNCWDCWELKNLHKSLTPALKNHRSWQAHALKWRLHQSLF